MPPGRLMKKGLAGEKKKPGSNEETFAEGAIGLSTQ